MTLLYENPLSRQEDIQDFILEGQAKITFANGCMELQNALPSAQGQKANYVLWCPQEFPADIRIEWEFRPLKEPGLCILFFAAAGKDGMDMFDAALSPRTGEYPQYHHGDINAFHVSYFRRKETEERAFHTCNLRKSYGFQLVAQGADPMPDAAECQDFYRMAVEKQGSRVRFFINDLLIFDFTDDAVTYGAPLKGGRIGFRQLAPLVAEYRKLRVYSL